MKLAGLTVSCLAAAKHDATSVARFTCCHPEADLLVKLALAMQGADARPPYCDMTFREKQDATCGNHPVGSRQESFSLPL